MFETVEPFAGTTTRAGKRKQRLLTLVVLSLVVVLITGLVGGALGVIPVLGRDDERVNRVEPGAGLWSTWLLKSGDQFRPAAPPNRRSTAQENRELKRLAGERDQTVLASIAFWNTGAPAYRWNEIAVHETLKHNQGAIIGSRSLALLNAAIYDATIAAWDAKYTYGRPRPGMVDRSLETVVAAPHSPSYPSEHAVTAGAASEVLQQPETQGADTPETIADASKTPGTEPDRASASETGAAVDTPGETDAPADEETVVSALSNEATVPQSAAVPDKPGNEAVASETAEALPETDRRVIWPLFWRYRHRFFMAHIDCRGETLKWQVEQPANDAAGPHSTPPGPG